jgi:DNA-binding NarL/FixJ family response regulator
MPGKLTSANGSAVNGSAANGLTRREHEIVRLATAGLTNQAIASELAITQGTVKLHLHNIYQKLGVKRRTALAAHLREIGRK